MDFSDVVGILGGIAAIVAAFVTYKNAQVSAKEAEVQVLRDIIAELTEWRDQAKEQIKTFKSQIAALECEVQKWKSYALELYNKMQSHGMEPPKIEEM